MADRHRGISLQEQLRHRTPYDLTATNDTSVDATDRNVGTIQKFDDSRRRARHKRRTTPCQPATVYRMNGIDVLFRSNRFYYARLFHFCRERQLDQNTVHIVAQV